MTALEEVRDDRTISIGLPLFTDVLLPPKIAHRRHMVFIAQMNGNSESFVGLKKIIVQFA